MTAPVLAAGHGGTFLWYLTRATGIVAFVLLSAALVMGIVASVGWTAERWPRFVSQNIHRNLSLFCLALVCVHVLTTVADGYVPIGLADAFVPFQTPYRPVWVGLGAVAFDIMLAVLLTSALRNRLGHRAWRAVHWLSYACWPVALLHALGTGTDTRLSLISFTNIVCVASVLAAIAWRLITGHAIPARRRAVSAMSTVVVTFGIGLFAALGPFRPEWSRHAGTSAALLRSIQAAQYGSAAQVGAPPASGKARSSPASTTPASTTPTRPSTDVPSVPFTSSIAGSYATSNPDGEGEIQVTISTHLVASPQNQLVIVLKGLPVDGGVSMSSSHVSFGPYTGVVTRLSGTSLTATVTTGHGPEIGLEVGLQLDEQAGTVTGTVSGATSTSDTG